MIGWLFPVVGAEARICKINDALGTGNTTELTGTIGVGVLAGIFSA